MPGGFESWTHDAETQHEKVYTYESTPVSWGRPTSRWGETVEFNGVASIYCESHANKWVSHCN